VLGVLPKDKHSGKLVEVWAAAAAGSGLQQVGGGQGWARGVRMGCGVGPLA
jgi:hypothetical protein